MYYKLKEDLRLRGWELLPTGIVRPLSEAVSFMPTDVYRALQKACSSIPVNSPLFSPTEKKYLKELTEEGILKETDTPVPLSEEQKYRAYPNRFLYSVHWSITGNCNCRCRHCYMSAPTRMDALVRAQSQDATHLGTPTRMDALVRAQSQDATHLGTPTRMTSKTSMVDEPSLEDCYTHTR